MANTYSQLYIQIVFSVKRRQRLISKEHKEELQKYITGIIQNRNTKLLAISCMPDHIHILVGMKPNTLLSDLVRDIKVSSTKFINENNWMNKKFRWQEGFGAFSYSHSHLDRIIRYINNQEEHHQKRKFEEEYLDLLQKYYVEYDDLYVFD